MGFLNDEMARTEAELTAAKRTAEQARARLLGATRRRAAAERNGYRTLPEAQVEEDAARTAYDAAARAARAALDARGTAVAAYDAMRLAHDVARVEAAYDALMLHPDGEILIRPRTRTRWDVLLVQTDDDEQRVLRPSWNARYGYGQGDSQGDADADPDADMEPIPVTGYGVEMALPEAKGQVTVGDLTYMSWRQSELSWGSHYSAGLADAQRAMRVYRAAIDLAHYCDLHCDEWLAEDLAA